MKHSVNRIYFIGFACVFSLLLAAVTVQAQEPVPTPAPAPPTVTNTYAAKFICGVQRDGALTAVPDAQAGHYSTKINVHNNTGQTIVFRKKVIQLKGGQVAIEPQFRRDEKLPPDWAMEVVCRDIYGHLGIPIPPIPPPPTAIPPPYIEGFVIFEVFFNPLPTNPPNDPLDVEGIYTYRAEPVGTDAVAIDVVVYPAKSNRHPLSPVVAEPGPEPAALNRGLQHSQP
jgi:hypothetical protein